MMNLEKIKAKKGQEKITMLTAYDFVTAQILDECGLDMILVGDSLGMVFQGKQDTLTVTMEQMLYHTRVVAVGVTNSLLVADLPFLSYQCGVSDAVRNAGALLQAGAQAVKLEGLYLEEISAMVKAGIPVMGHIGFTPQSVKQLSGYKVQGKTELAAEQLIQQAQMLQDAGVFSLVMEMTPAELGKRISEKLHIPVIGCGAGPYTDGQVLVITDVLGLSPRTPKFAKQFANLKTTTRQAVQDYLHEVKESKFPDGGHSF